MNKTAPNIVDIRLNWYQDKFIFSPVRYCALIAGVGTGKTFASLFRAWQFCQENPKALGLIVRKEFTDLRDSTIKDFENYFNVKINAQNKEYTFPNGAKIMFRHGDMNDINVLKNINLSFFSIEQAEEYDNADIFHFLRDRLRRPGSARWGALIANANGHNWIYDLFINGAKSNVHDKETGQIFYQKDNYMAATANSFANAHNLPADFVADLRAMETEAPQHYMQYVMNDFNVIDADDLVFTPEELGKISLPISGTPIYESRVMGVDLARFGKDKCVAFVGESLGGFKFTEIACDSWAQKDAIYSVGRIADFGRQMRACDACVDADGLGGPIFDNLKDLINDSFGVKEFHNRPTDGAYANVRTEAYFGLKDLAGKGWLHIETPEIINDLASLRYTFNSKGQKMLVPKHVLRAKGMPSPDYADALMMSFWLWRQSKPTMMKVRRFRKPAYIGGGNLSNW